MSLVKGTEFYLDTYYRFRCTLCCAFYCVSFTFNAVQEYNKEMDLPTIEALKAKPTRLILWTTVTIFILAALAIFLPSVFVPSGPSDGATVKWRPDPVVFVTVWALIALAVTIAWTMFELLESDAVSKNIARVLFVGFLICCALWQIAYHKVSKESGIVVFLALHFFLVPLIMHLYSRGYVMSAMLLTTPLIWALFAMVINIEEVKNRRTRRT